MALAWLTSGWIFVSSAARASGCAEPYVVDAMLEDLISVETALREEDDVLANHTGKELELGLGCMTESIPRMIVARVLRAIGSGLVAGGEVTRAEGWFRTAVELEPSFDFGLEDLPEFHLIRGVYELARASSGGEEILLDGANFQIGTAWLDGRKILEPRARLDRVHLFRFDTEIDSKTWVINGNQFPGEILIFAPSTARQSRGENERSRATSALETRAGENLVVMQRQRPWEKTPLLIGGVSIAVGSAAVYYASYVARKKFDTSNDVDELTLLQSRVNRLAITSAALLATGTGTVTWGVILDGERFPLPSLRIHF